MTTNPYLAYRTVNDQPPEGGRNDIDELSGPYSRLIAGIFGIKSLALCNRSSGQSTDVESVSDDP